MRLDELATLLGARVVGDPGVEVDHVRPLDEAGTTDLSFLHNNRYIDQAKASKAAAILIADAGELPGRTLLVCDEPYLALARALEILAPRAMPGSGIHPSAVIDETAVVGEDVTIGPCVSVGPGCRVERGARIGAGCMLVADVHIGENTLLHPRVVVEDGCRIGNRCILQAGVVIGSDGFGFATVDGVHHKVPQVGIVVVEDDVELGANVCIDRATLGETRIGRGVKVDNLVQIAHNVVVGEGSILVSQVGIAGSTKLGRYVVMGGQAGAAGHLTVGDGAQVTGKSAIFKDVEPGEIVSGVPARPRREWTKTQAGLARLSKLREKVRKLERRIEELEVDSD